MSNRISITTVSILLTVFAAGWLACLLWAPTYPDREIAVWRDSVAAYRIREVQRLALDSARADTIRRQLRTSANILTRTRARADSLLTILSNRSLNYSAEPAGLSDSANWAKLRIIVMGYEEVVALKDSVIGQWELRYAALDSAHRNADSLVAKADSIFGKVERRHGWRTHAVLVGLGVIAARLIL